MRGRAPALPAQLSSFCKKPDGRQALDKAGFESTSGAAFADHPPEQFHHGDRIDQLKPCANGALGIVFVRLGVAEICERSVADVFGDRAAELVRRGRAIL